MFGPERVRTIPRRVGVASLVQPHSRPPLTVGRVGKKAVDDSLVGVARLICVKSLGLFRCGRKTTQIQAEPSQQHLPVCPGRGFESLFLQAIDDPEVDAGARPRPVYDLGNRFRLRGEKCPVRSVFGSLLDPAAQNLDVLRREPIARLPGRHSHRVVFRGDPHDQFARIRIAGDDRQITVLEGLDGRIAAVEPQALGSLRLILAVAGKTVLAPGSAARRGYSRPYRQLRPAPVRRSPEPDQSARS